MTTTNLIEKLKKILALAHRGATEGEIQAAMHKAQQLAAQNNIDLASIDMSLEDVQNAMEIDRETILSKRSRTRRPQHTHIAHILMDCFDVKFIWTNGTGSAQCCIVGEKTDVAMATFVFHWLDGLFPKVYRKYTKAQGIQAGGPGDTAVLQNSYYGGLRLGIIRNNQRARQEVERTVADADKYALVLTKKSELVEQKYHEFFPNVRFSHSRRRQHDSEAGAAGFRDGENINLNAGLNAAPNHQRVR